MIMLDIFNTFSMFVVPHPWNGFDYGFSLMGPLLCFAFFLVQ